MNSRIAAPCDPGSFRRMPEIAEGGLPIPADKPAVPKHVFAALLAAAVDQSAGRHITVNATGATAAVLSDMRVPIAAMRGFAVISRAAGLVAHLIEEQQRPSGRFIWDLVDKSIPFDFPPGGSHA